MHKGYALHLFGAMLPMSRLMNHMPDEDMVFSRTWTHYILDGGFCLKKTPSLSQRSPFPGFITVATGYSH